MPKHGPGSEGHIPWCVKGLPSQEGLESGGSVVGGLTCCRGLCQEVRQHWLMEAKTVFHGALMGHQQASFVVQCVAVYGVVDS